MVAPLLEAHELSKGFGGLVAVWEIDLAIVPGEIHAIIGPNGAGKTTLFNLISGFLQPDSGSISFRGREITHLPAHARARAGIVRSFQNIRLFRDLTVRENVLVGQHSRARAGATSLFSWLSTRERALRTEAEDLLQLFGLGEYRDRAAGTLPYGVQKRVEMARALASRPVLLLLDEPTAGMPPNETDEIAREICSIRDRGVTVALVEHDMSLVMGITDRITVLNFGEKIAEGRPDDVREDPKVVEAYLGQEE